MTWTGLAFTASLTEIALPKNAFWEEEYYLAHCTVGEVIALPPGFEERHAQGSPPRKRRTMLVHLGNRMPRFLMIFGSVLVFNGF